MTQKEKLNVESIGEFIKRSIDETVAEGKDLHKHATLRSDGLGLADIGAKIAFVEGKLQILGHIRYIAEQNGFMVDIQTNEVDLLTHEELEDPESRLARMESEGLVD